MRLHWRSAKAESRKYHQIELLITHPIEVCAVPSTKRIILFDQPRTLADSVGDHFARPWESKGHRSCTPHRTAACGERFPRRSAIVHRRWFFLVDGPVAAFQLKGRSNVTHLPPGL